MATETVWADTDKTIVRDLSTRKITATWSNTSGKGYTTANTLATTEATNTAAAAVDYTTLVTTIAPGKRVIWDDGKTWINISRLTIDKASSPTVMPDAWVRDIPEFNVATYGAVGNGTTNDATAIQAAIDAAYAAGGGYVRFGAGLTYLVDCLQTGVGDYRTDATEGLILKSNVHLLLDGATIKAKPRTNTTDKCDLFVAHFASHVSIIGGTLKGDRRTRATPVADGVDVTFSLARFIECDHVTLDRSRFIESVGEGTSFRIYSINLEGCSTTSGSAVMSVPNSGDNVYRLTRLKVGEIIDTNQITCFPAGATVVSVNNVSPRSVTLSTPATATETGLYMEFHPAANQHHVIRRNTFDDNRFNGMVVESGRGFLIEDNTFSNTQGTSPAAGIDIEPYYGTAFLFDVVFRGNHTFGNAGGGLLVQNMTNALVEANDFDDYVMFRAVSQGTFTDNTALYMSIKVAGVAVQNNIFTGVGISIYNYAADHFRDPLDVTIDYNRFTSADGVSCLTLYNEDDDPAEYRALAFRHNTYAATGATTMSTRVITRDTSAVASFATVDISDNSFTIANPHDASEVFRMPRAGTSVELQRNTVALTSATLRSGTVIFNCTAFPVHAVSNVITKVSASGSAFSGTVTGSGNTLNGSAVGP